MTEVRFEVPHNSVNWRESIDNPVGLDAQVELFQIYGVEVRRVTEGFGRNHYMDVYASTVEVNLHGQGRSVGGRYVLRITP
jgi:hypothetical protein